MATPITAIVVDDEPNAIKALKASLEKHCREVQVVAEANNISEALRLIILKKPALVFLDINMPHGSGFDLLNQLKLQGTDPVGVIFTTAHQEYAIKALRLSALDYLLKPIDAGDLVNAVDRFKKSQYNSKSSHFDLLTDLLKDHGEPKKIAINTTDSIHLVRLEDIFYLAAEKNYTQIHFADSSLLASKSLRFFEDLLDEFSFIRPHRSTLVNLSKVVEFRKKKLEIVLSNGAVVEVSRSSRDAVFNELRNF